MDDELLKIFLMNAVVPMSKCPEKYLIGMIRDLFELFKVDSVGFSRFNVSIKRHFMICQNMYK